MEEQNVAVRLKHFISQEGLSYSQFADACGIPRPTLSQLLSGRNKKLSDQIVRLIHDRYPSLSVLWLMFGEGDMLVAGSHSDSAIAPERLPEPQSHAVQDGLESVSGVLDNSVNQQFDISSDATGSNGSSARVSDTEPDVPYYRCDPITHERLEPATFQRSSQPFPGGGPVSGSGPFASQQPRERVMVKEVEKVVRVEKRVSSITVFYDDNSYETFLPEQRPKRT